MSFARLLFFQCFGFFSIFPEFLFSLFSAVVVCFSHFSCFVCFLQDLFVLQRQLPCIRLRSNFDRFSSLITGVYATMSISFHFFGYWLMFCDVLSFSRGLVDYLVWIYVNIK